MTTPKLHPDLKEFLCCLDDHRVRFIVLGGHVLATLGRPRYTDDLDVLGLTEFVKTKRACGRTKDLLDLELLREAGLLPAETAPRKRPTKKRH